MDDVYWTDETDSFGQPLLSDEVPPGAKRLEPALDRFREFRVCDESNPSREGLCRSYYDHFEIDWDGGEEQRGILDLSDIGVSKVFKEDGTRFRQKPA